MNGLSAGAVDGTGKDGRVTGRCIISSCNKAAPAVAPLAAQQQASLVTSGSTSCSELG